MDENNTENHTELNIEEEVIDTQQIIKKVRKSRKIKTGRKNQKVLRKLFRFFMTIFLIFSLVYFSKMPQWYLPKNAYTTVHNDTILILNNKIVKPYRVLAFLKLHKVPEVPIYLMKTSDIERDIKKLAPIKDVYIRRYAFPARLQIIIKERVPVISIATDEKSPLIGAYTEDGIFIGHDFMPLSPDLKTVKVLSQNKNISKWDIEKIREIQQIASSVAFYSNERVEYIDLRNPNDVFVKITGFNVRIGKIDSKVYERIKRLSSILPKIKSQQAKIKYVDVGWEKVNYLKLK